MSELLEYKCPNCGGSVEFSSEIQKLKCPFCDAEFDLNELNALNEEMEKEIPDKMDWENVGGAEFEEGESDTLKNYICNSCGGEIITDETTLATTCPFCDSAVVMTENMKGVYKPDYVIPFKLDKDEAKLAFARHLKGKKLLPKLFKTDAHIDEIKGIYVPFWLYDADTDASVRYHATRLFKWSDSRYIYTRTSHYSLFRAGGVSFARVPVDGSSKMPDELMESLEPFSFSDVMNFNSACLAGYFADKYDVTPETCIGRANQRIKTSVEKIFYETVGPGFASVRMDNSNVNLKNGTSKYALYPVWILNTTYKGEKYTFAMNGQTGKFVGDLPVDKSAAALWFSGVFAGSAALFYGIASLIAWLL